MKKVEFQWQVIAPKFIAQYSWSLWFPLLLSLRGASPALGPVCFGRLCGGETVPYSWEGLASCHAWAEGFYLGFIFALFYLHLATTTQLGTDVETVSFPFCVSVVGFNSVVNGPVFSKQNTHQYLPVLELTVLLPRDSTHYKKKLPSKAYKCYISKCHHGKGNNISLAELWEASVFTYHLSVCISQLHNTSWGSIWLDAIGTKG